MRKKLILQSGILALLASGACAMAQVIGVQPEPLGLYGWNPTGSQWSKVPGSATAQAAPSTPRPAAFYVYNSNLNQWVPLQVDGSGNIQAPWSASGLNGNPAVTVS